MMDYTTMKEGWKPGDNKPTSEFLAERKWWNKKGKELGHSAKTVCDSLKVQATHRHQLNLVHARLYGNVDINSFGARDYTRSATWYGRGIPNRITFNVVATCIEALGSKVGKQRPRPTFLTAGGSWKGQQRARKANLWAQGLFYETHIHELAKKVRLSAYTFGTGALRVWVEKKGKVCAEPVFIDDVYVDDADGIYGKPRQLFVRMLADREVLSQKYPSAAIPIAATATDGSDTVMNGVSDVVEVWEGWHLPSSKGAKDGKHVIITGDGVVLLEESWALDCFPFVFRRYRSRLQGFWGQGIAEILTGIQRELNRLNTSISEQLRRRGRGRTFVQAGAVDENAFDNSFSPIVKTKGPPGAVVMVDNTNAVAGEEFAERDRLYSRAFQEVGLSELSAAAKKPSGLDAAVALREYNDIESERFAFDAQADENFFLDFTRLAMKLVQEFAPESEVRIPSKQFAKVVKWGEIAVDPDDFVIQMFPVSSLPTHPSARLQRVNELVAGGYIDIPTAKRLLDFPDVEAEQTLANAALDNIDWCLSKILDEPKPKMPLIEKYQDLSQLVPRATAAYLAAQHFDIEEERLQMLRDFIDMATNEMTKTLAAQASIQAGLPANALGGGMPAPASGGGSINNTVNVEPTPPTPAVPPLIS
jgi:hypothetical protein